MTNILLDDSDTNNNNNEKNSQQQKNIHSTWIWESARVLSWFVVLLWCSQQVSQSQKCGFGFQPEHSKVTFFFHWITCLGNSFWLVVIVHHFTLWSLYYTDTLSISLSINYWLLTIQDMSLVVIQQQNILHTKSFLSVRLDLYLNKQPQSRISNLVFSLVSNHSHRKLYLGGTKIVPISKMRYNFYPVECQQGLPDEDDDDDVCPVECVREFKTDEEFLKILDKSKGTGSLVVVDFFRTSCGSCKYIEQGFAKLCKKSGSNDVPVIFLKHNVSILYLLLTVQFVYGYY